MMWKAKTRTVLVLLSVLVVVVLGIALHRMRQSALAEIPPPPTAPWALSTETVVEKSITRGFPVLATVTTSRQITVTGQISGTLLEMGPREGVSVKAGDVLARIDTRELRERLAALKAQIEAAKAAATNEAAELEREEDLLKDGGSSETAVEARRTSAVAAKQKLESLERQASALQVRVGYGVITAAADGVVASRLAEPGDVCAPGHPLYRLNVTRGGRVRVELPQSVLEQVHPGTRLVLEHAGESSTIQLDRVYPALDAHALGAAEADLPRRLFDLPSGARVSSRVILEQRDNALSVPLQALVAGPTPESATVWKVVRRDGAATLQSVPVRIVLRGREGVAVEGELEPGDDVVVAHESVLLKLEDGAPVILPEEPRS